MAPRQSRFNSRAHGGRDPDAADLLARIPVSIHAPTGGATRKNLVYCSSSARFQFTRPRGARPRGTLICVMFHVVSIHAPTGGATRSAAYCARYTKFQFTRPRGARLFALAAEGYWCVSIHAPTGGATLDEGRNTGFNRRFNSRAHGGRDICKSLNFPSCNVSIHAPTGGATRVPQQVAGALGVSIHAPTGGATKFAMQGFTSAIVSIHAPTGGATKKNTVARALSMFQFTRPRGARQGEKRRRVD